MNFKNSLKIIGVMTAIMIAVTLGIGSVSAAGTPIFNGTVTVVNNSFAQTTVPVDYMNPGQYVYADTDAGILNAAYDRLNGGPNAFTYNLTCVNGTWSISDINGYATAGNKKWYVYINNTNRSYLDPSLPIPSGSTVAFVYTDKPKKTLTKTIDLCDRYILAGVTVQNSPTTFCQGNVSSSAGTFNVTLNNISFTNVSNNSGLGVLMRGAVPGTYTYSLGAGTYNGTPFTWLNDINGTYPDWSATGYGYSIFKESNNILTVTDSLEKFNLTDGESLIIMITASSSGGVIPIGYNGTALSDPYGTDYYPDAATHILKLTLV